jgi:orotidine-5'-phosphate decarboxylase
MKKENGLILALDVIDREEALRLIGYVADYLDAIKVNYPLILSSGIEIIKELSDIKPVIADFKIADIPYTSSLSSELAFKAGASGIIVHGFSGRDTVSAVINIASRYKGDVFVVSELSNEGGKEFLTPVSDKIVQMANDLGCSGIIAPATRPERIAHFRKIARNLTIISPGVGAQGGILEDVIRAGADFIIVGRSIYNAENPGKVAKEYADRIEQILKKR